MPLRRLLSIVVLGIVFLAVALPSGAQDWQPIPLVTEAGRAAGQRGGEGAQVILTIASDATGRFLMMGTDVGGLYRSLDAGKTWSPCNVGYKPRGVSQIVIDPNDSSHVLCVATNSSAWDWHGIWESTDKGATWTGRLLKKMSYGPKGQLAFDPSSASHGMSRIAYWSCPQNGGLYKTTDGGTTWTQISTQYGDSYLRVHPTRGSLYLGNADGLFRSDDKGKTFRKLLSRPVTGLDVSPAQPDFVSVCTKNYEVLVSLDCGASFTKRAANGLPTSTEQQGAGWYDLRVSPGDPDVMLISHDSGFWARQPRFYSHDGGNTWAAPTIDASLSFLPGNLGRTETPAFDPANPSIIFSNGGDYITKSTDGGKTYTFANTGYSGIMSTGAFGFNFFHPDVLLLTSQDYNAALTTDGGRTWTYLPVSGQDWGGFTYGGYAFDANVMFAGNAPNWGGTRTLRVSRDGGHTWTDTGSQGSTTAIPDAAMGDANAPNTAFWDEYRTDDQGKTWTKMTNCDRVVTSDSSGTHTLYGICSNTLVRSQDDGRTWETLVKINANLLTDAAYDGKHQRLYAMTDNRRLWQYEIKTGTLSEITARLPLDNNGTRAASTVACDPVDPEIVYIGNHGDIYDSSVSVARSQDGGITWGSLTKQPGQSGEDGGHEATCVRVNPKDRSLWVEGECFGNWRFLFSSSRHSMPAL